MADLSINAGGLKMKNPVMIASSPLTAKLSLLKEAEENGAGGVSIKHTMMHQAFRARPRWYHDPDLGIVVSGDPRLEPDFACELVRQAKEQTDLTIVVNMSGAPGNLESWGTIAGMLKQAGADAVELNFNCPNLLSAGSKAAAQGSNLGTDPEACRLVVEEVRKAVDIPVVVKLNTEGGMILKVAAACARDEKVIMNVHMGGRSAPGIDIYQGGKFLYPGSPKGSLGGFSGPWGRTMSNRYIADVARALPQSTVIGGSGLETWSQMIETIMFGAKCVTVCTSVMKRGFGVVKTAVEAMARFLDEQGYRSIDEICGRALQNIVAPAEMVYKEVAAVIDSRRCTGCKSCTKMPTCTAIRYEESTRKCVVTPEACIGCGLCLGVCPKKAIDIVEL